MTIRTAGTFEETVAAGGHKDATMHVGGHGEPWPEVKVIAVTDRNGQTRVCVRRGGDEKVIPAGSVREGLEIFADELWAATRELPGSPAEETDDARADAELSRRITAELGYMHGLIDVIRAAPGEVDVAVFLDRIERVVTALEAVQSANAGWDAYNHGNGEWPKDALSKGVVMAGVAVTREITKQISSALRIEAPAAAESQTAGGPPG